MIPNTHGCVFRKKPIFAITADSEIIAYFQSLRHKDICNLIERVAKALNVHISRDLDFGTDEKFINFKDITLEQVKIAHIGTFKDNDVTSYNVYDHVNALPAMQLIEYREKHFNETAADVIPPRPTSKYRLAYDPWGNDASEVTSMMTHTVDGVTEVWYDKSELVSNPGDYKLRNNTKSFHAKVKKMVLYYKLSLLRL